MARIVKKPEDRKFEIMEKAAELFMTKGYDETSVNTIVESLSIAKGTFYHYFTSKEEILTAILEQYMDSFAENIKRQIANEKLDAFEKLQVVLASLFKNPQGPQQLTAHIEDNKDAKLHKVMEDKFYEKFKPIILEVLNEGIKEEVFKLTYAEEITEILLIGVRGYMHIHIPQFAHKEYRERKLAAIEELFNNILGMSEKKFEFH